MPYIINTAKAKIKEANGNYRSIDVFSDQLDETKEAALDAIGRDDTEGARRGALEAITYTYNSVLDKINQAKIRAINDVSGIADRINNITSNQVTDVSAVANMVAQHFDQDNTYKSGDYVRYTTTDEDDIPINKLYRLTMDHSAGVAWENTSKIEVKISSEISLLSNLLFTQACPIHITWTQGKINSGTGNNQQNSGDTYRVRTNNYYPVKKLVAIQVADGYKCAICLYSSTQANTYQGAMQLDGSLAIDSVGWLTGINYLSGIDRDYYYRLVFARQDDQNFSQETEWEKKLTVYVTPDDMLATQFNNLKFTLDTQFNNLKFTLDTQFNNLKFTLDTVPVNIATYTTNNNDRIPFVINGANKAITRGDNKDASIQIALNGYKKISITANNTTTFYTFLQTKIDPDAILENSVINRFLAPGELGRHTIAANTTVTTTFPTAANYVIITVKNNDDDTFAPSSIVLIKKETVDKIQDLFEPIKTEKSKKVSIFGDSISTFTGWIPEGNVSYYTGDISNVATVQDTWWKKTINALGYELLVNNSWSGRAVSSCRDEETEHRTDAAYKEENILQLSKDGNEPDIIIIKLGINDFNHGALLGSYDGSTTLPDDPSTFTAAYAIMLNRIMTQFPLAKVYCCTLMQCESNNGIGFPETNRQNESLIEWNNAIRDLAHAFGADVIEHDVCGITYYNLSTYMGDYDASSMTGLHPNADGHSLIAKQTIKQILF